MTRNSKWDQYGDLPNANRFTVKSKEEKKIKATQQNATVNTEQDASVQYSDAAVRWGAKWDF